MEMVFLCLAKDVARTFPVFLSYLESLESQGIRCSAIVGENGSRDQTRDLILKASHSRIYLLDTSFMAECKSRLARMARGREALLDCLATMNSEYDYVCVADLDNVIAQPPGCSSVSAAIAELRRNPALFAVGATSQPVYYDLLSLRAPGQDYTNLAKEIASAKTRPLSYFRFHKERMYRNQIAMTSTHAIACKSSFNGFCIYNAADYRLGTYRAMDEADVCEHATFNLSIGNATGKHMLILPDLYVRTPDDHGPTGFAKFWYDRIAERLPFRAGA